MKINLDQDYLAISMGKVKIMTNREINDLEKLGFVVDVVRKIDADEWKGKGNWVSPEAYKEYLIKEASKNRIV